MIFFSEVKQRFNVANILVSERMDTVETSSQISITVQDFLNFEVIQSICSLVPTRDTLIMTFKNNSGELLIVSNKQSKKYDVVSFTDGMTTCEYIEVQIQIDKTVYENRFSIYDFESFANDLVNRPVTDVLKWFSVHLASLEYLVFEVFDGNVSFSTGTMAFTSCKDILFTPKLNRGNRLYACKEISYFFNMSMYEVIPDDFIIAGIEQSDNHLKNLFGRLSTMLSLIYSATSASIHDDILNIQINGLRTSNSTINLNDIEENTNWLSVYSWIYTEGNPTDKSLIAHNVISLHCKYAPLMEIDKKAFDSIRSNYRLYLRANVGNYLDLKRDISKFIQGTISQVGEYTISILSKFKTNLLAIFVFLFTVVITRIGATQRWEEIFTRHTIYLIEVVLIGSLGYLMVCIFEACYKFRKTKQSYYMLKKNYSDILTDEEIKEAFNNDAQIIKATTSVKKGMIGWSVVWGVALITAIIFIEMFAMFGGLFVLILDNCLIFTSK